MKKLQGLSRYFLTGSALLLLNLTSYAQSYTDSLAQDDKDILSSIAPYAPEVRTAILGVSQYPQALVKIERVQARSSQSFQDMVESYPRDEQEKLYEASRFPDLTLKLTEHGRMSDADVTPLLKDFPEATQTRLRSTYATHYDDLVRMNALYQSSQDALQKIIGSYPQDIQDDFRKVVSMPDVVNLLTENINLTVSLGEEYKADPNGVRQQLDQLSAQLNDQNAKDLASYKQEVENDPKLQTEMKSAATDFSSQYDQQDNPNYVTNNYYDNYPYPYWTSYPYWYSSPIWYPRPMYYHTGFYYGPGGGLVVVGLPSRIYSNWFFGSGYRHYPIMYHHYNSYYNYHNNFYRGNVYRGNGNVYRGFNSAAQNHFSPRTRGNAGPVNNGRNSGNVNPGRSSAPRNNDFNATRSRQMNVAPSNFNNRGMQQFHATTYHSMGWQHVSGARTGGSVTRPSSAPMHSGGMNGGGRSSGGGRSNGGGGRGRH